jgi:cytosine/adenosine deaminase-related metal-dependent hydrolase
MILDNLIIKGQKGKQQILIHSGKIKAVKSSEPGAPKRKSNGMDPLPAKDATIQFDGAMAIPGLINSHDHLDFNLYPQLGNRIYNNYVEWAADIQRNNKNVIDAVRRIPKALRIQWGLYKNLLNGFTTVVNHGERISIEDDLISVFQDCYSLHSTSFNRNWKWKLNNLFQWRKPYVMHIGEGKDEMAKKEIDTVIRSNWFGKKIIAVHGIGMDRLHASSFEGLVWCPYSNKFLIGKTAPVNDLKAMMPVVFGTDSTLSSNWNAWEHFRSGILQSAISEEDLLTMLTKAPAVLWEMDDRGELAADKWADIVVMKSSHYLFSCKPEDILLVMHRGHIRMYDESIADQLKAANGHSFSRIKLNESTKFVQGDIQGLIKNIRSYYNGAIFPTLT